jgi:hypothetical protein
MLDMHGTLHMYIFWVWLLLRIPQTYIAISESDFGFVTEAIQPMRLWGSTVCVCICMYACMYVCDRGDSAHALVGIYGMCVCMYVWWLYFGFTMYECMNVFWCYLMQRTNHLWKVMYAKLHLYIHVCIHIYIFLVHIHICIYLINIHAYIYTYTWYTYIYVYIYTYTWYTHTW